jgi:diguanylate cyclase (GGDEF)-like protein
MMVADPPPGQPIGAHRYQGPAAWPDRICHTSLDQPIGGTTGSPALEQHIPSTAIRGLSTGALTRRMLMGAVLAVLAFAAAFQVATTLADASMAMAVVFGSGAALVVAAAVMSRTISPIVAGQQELQVRYEAALADALRDPLTGLGNHRAFHEELDRQVAAAMRYGTPLALMLIDLDEFKALNDTKGHAGGDRALRGFGELLSSTLRRADRAYRVGGDEFAAILPHTDLEGAKIVGRRVLAQALQPALRLEDLEPVSFSGGISALPEMAANRTQLFSQADAALYAAKRNGRTDVVGYDPSVDAAGEPASGTAAAAITEVIARGQLKAVYQPIVSLANGTVIGVEGLIRPVPPAPFADPGALFEAAEAGGRLTALDLACVETIVAGAGDLPEDQFLSLNLSPPTVESPEFTSAALLAILARHGFPRNRLVVELTERQAIHDVERVRSRLEALREAGVRIAADDIGAGNSGLRLLAEISFDVLKVDLGLVQRSASSESSTAVLGSVVALASRMGALVIAEGIEQASQLPQLSELGIQAGQGFHLGRPGPIETAAPVLEPVAVEMSAWRESLGLPSAS